MEHYICKGECKTKKDSPSKCLTEQCSKYGQDLASCSCTDDLHKTPTPAAAPIVGTAPVEAPVAPTETPNQTPPVAPATTPESSSTPATGTNGVSETPSVTPTPKPTPETPETPAKPSM